MPVSLQAKDVAKICYYAAVNKKLPEEEIQAQWDALSQDPEALMRVSNKFGELRPEALQSDRPSIVCTKPSIKSLLMKMEQG